MTSTKQALEQTSKGWDSTAQVYSDVFSKFSENFARDALDWTMGETPVQGAKVLDIAAGNGSTSFPAAARVKSVGGSVLATDFSPLMIEQLKSKIGADSGCIEAQVMDGQNLTLPDNSFNYVYSTFGLIFFPSREKGLSEIHRVLVPGGKVAIAAWSLQTPVILAREAVNILHPTYTPPSQTVTSLADPVQFEKMLASAGFKNITIHESRHDFKPTIDDYIAFGATNPPTVSIKELLPADKIPLFDDTVRQIAQDRWPGAPTLCIPTLAYIGVGEK
eukprot:gene9102-10673_t